MSNPAIRVENLSKQYQIGAREKGYTTFREALSGFVTNPFRRFKALSGRVRAEESFWALKDVSFDVQPGDVVGIIGRNGSGKSTLLKVLSQITEPTTGQIEINGRVASLLEVGTGFHSELSGRENIYLNGSILGMSRSETKRKFDEIVAFAEVERFLDTPVKRYSSGMYVRLAFAVAAHLEPEILIVDEVLAVGDFDFQRKCLQKMQTFAKCGGTILFVSHNMPALENLCTHGVLLNGGQVTTTGACSEVVDRYMVGIRDESERTCNAVRNGTTQHIRAFSLRDRGGQPRDAFATGDDIIFEVELHSREVIENPRCGILINSPRGERLATLNTYLQERSTWALHGSKRLRAIWRNVPLNVGRYRLDVNLWHDSRELELVVGLKTLDILPRDIYGTGWIPDSTAQGCIVPDAKWEMNVE